MKSLKKFLALTLCLAFVVLCFAGCHEKGEIAVTVGDVQFTSGDYACALLFADIAAQEKVIESLEETQAVITDKKDLYKQKIDDVEYVKWVENTALDNLKLMAATISLCDKENATMDSKNKDAKDYLAEVNEVVEAIWENPAYVEIMEKNGIGKETFVKYTYYTAIHTPLFLEALLGEGYAPSFSNPLFNKIYGKGGKKEISEQELKTHLTDNYILINLLTDDFDGLTEEKITEIKNKFAAYKTSLEDGSKTFEQLYLEENKETAEEHKHEEPKEGESAPKDYHATIIDKDSTDYYEIVKSMSKGEIKVITLYDEEDKEEGLALVIKKDILEDPYYLTEFDIMLREEIVDEDLVNDIKKQANKLNCDVNTKSTKQFNVKKIHYPEATAQY